jgi:hypothetical protein
MADEAATALLNRIEAADYATSTGGTYAYEMLWLFRSRVSCAIQLGGAHQLAFGEEEEEEEALATVVAEINCLHSQ